MSVAAQEIVGCDLHPTTKCDAQGQGIGCPSSGLFCYPGGYVGQCVKLTGDEVYMGLNGSLYAPPGTYLITSNYQVWSGAPMMVCNLCTNDNGWGPFIWKRGRLVQDLG